VGEGLFWSVLWIQKIGFRRRFFPTRQKTRPTLADPSNGFESSARQEFTVSGSSVTGLAETSHQASVKTSRRFRIFASVLIIGHLWAVVGRPIEFATQGPFGTSPSATMLRSPVRAYSQFAYLDHGYAFFAPDPGPSHLIAATVTAPDGNTRELRYPDHGDQWPRLLYHRHFMLSEFLNNIYHPPGEPPVEIANNPNAARQWRMARRRYESVRDSIIDCVKKRYPDCVVSIERLEHRQPGLPEFFEQNVALDDDRLVVILADELESLGPEVGQDGPVVNPPAPPIGLLPMQLPISQQPFAPPGRAASIAPPASSIEQVRPLRVEAAPDAAQGIGDQDGAVKSETQP
jgi:hypothetical protein